MKVALLLYKLSIIINYIFSYEITIGAVSLVLLKGGIGSICSWEGSTWLVTGLYCDSNPVRDKVKTNTIKNVI